MLDFSRGDIGGVADCFGQPCYVAPKDAMGLGLLLGAGSVHAEFVKQPCICLQVHGIPLVYGEGRHVC
jgi:hypothetical protein